RNLEPAHAVSPPQGAAHRRVSQSTLRMPQQAKVTSVDALQDFRSNLLVYVSKARPALEEVSMDVMRVRVWLQDEQRVHWERELKRRLRKLEEAEQALFSSRLSNMRDPSMSEMRSVTKCRQSVEEARAKLNIIKKWNKDFDSLVEPLLKQLERLHT